MAKKQAGARLKLTDDLMTRIAGQIKKGNYVRTSCLAVGVSQSTFYAWKAQGETDIKAGKRTKYSAFVEMIDHADAVAQQRLVRTVINEGGWKGSLEILKRRFPKEFGDKTALSNADGSPLVPSGPAVAVTFKMDAPADDNPWLPDPNAPAPTDEPTEEQPPTDNPTEAP